MHVFSLKVRVEGGEAGEGLPGVPRRCGGRHGEDDRGRGHQEELPRPQHQEPPQVRVGHRVLCAFQTRFQVNQFIKQQFGFPG